ncbi:MAG: aspartate kinase [Erysipelotrichaceae bacterium]
MIVTKFGGSSLANAEQYKKVKDIVLSDSKRSIVIVSAAGKRDSEDNKITDLLYLCYAHVRYGVKYDDIFHTIKERYQQIEEELNLDVNLESQFTNLYIAMKSSEEDYVVSRGEYLSSILMAQYLGYEAVDAAELIHFNYDGSINEEETFKSIQAIIKIKPKIVVPGFYGSLPNQKIRLMQRGGSDITGAIIASALKAELYENWTDVSGILMADPKIVKNPLPISTISIAELREMAFMGASILHEDSISPLKAYNIPLNIRNTNEPKHPGTIIKQNFDQDVIVTDRFITGIAGKKSAIFITLFKEDIAKDTTTIRKTLEILDQVKISVQHLTMGIDSFTIVLGNQHTSDRLYDVIAEIKKQCELIDIRIEENIAMIAAVGRKMRLRSGISGQLFQALGENHINIRMITQGTDEISIIVGVSNDDYEKAIRVLYERFTG